MTSNQQSGAAAGSDDSVLSSYLHSHIVAAAAGVRLFEQASKVWKDSPHGTTLKRLRDEVNADKAELESVAHQLDLGIPLHKQALAWAGSQLSRFNPLNPWRTRGNLGSQLELEALETAVQGKVLLWNTLLQLADDDERINAGQIERLRGRAQGQVSDIDALLRETVPERFRQGAD